MKNYGGWEVIEPLGAGGQSEVFLVRSPQRVSQREGSIMTILTALNPRLTPNTSLILPTKETVPQFAQAVSDCTRSDKVSELGALKKFTIRGEEGEALKRLKREIEVLKQNRVGLLKLLDSNEKEQWIVTEYCPEGTIEKKPAAYKGKIAPALRAFRSLVETVAALRTKSFTGTSSRPTYSLEKTTH